MASGGGYYYEAGHSQKEKHKRSGFNKFNCQRPLVFMQRPINGNYYRP
jgi:hypothetical protein